MTGSHKASEEPAAPTAAAAGSTSSTAPPSSSPANIGSLSTAGACGACDACEPHGDDDAFNNPETFKVASQAAAPATTATAGRTAATTPPPPPATATAAAAAAAATCCAAVAATSPSSSQAFISQTARTAAASSSVRSVAHQGTNPAATASAGEAPAAATASAGEAPAAATASAGEAPAAAIASAGEAAAAATAGTGEAPATASAGEAPAAATASAGEAPSSSSSSSPATTGEATMAGSAAPASTTAEGPTPDVTQALDAISTSDAFQAESESAAYFVPTLSSIEADQLLSAVRSGQRSMVDVLKYLLLHRSEEEMLTLLSSALEQHLAGEVLHALAAEQHSLLLALLRIMTSRNTDTVKAAAVSFDRLVSEAGADVVLEAVLQADGAVPLLLEALAWWEHCCILWSSSGAATAGPVNAPHPAEGVFKMAYETSADNQTALMLQLVQAMQPLTQPLSGSAVQQHDQLQDVKRATAVAATAASVLTTLCIGQPDVPLDGATELQETAAVRVGTLYDILSSLVQQLQQLNEQKHSEQQQQQQQEEDGMHDFGTSLVCPLLHTTLEALRAICRTEPGRHALAQQDLGPLLAVIKEVLSMGVQQHQAGHSIILSATYMLLTATMEGLQGLQGVLHHAAALLHLSRSAMQQGQEGIQSAKHLMMVVNRISISGAAGRAVLVPHIAAVVDVLRAATQLSMESDGAHVNHDLVAAAAGAACAMRNIAAGEGEQAVAELLQPHVSTLLAACEVHSSSDQVQTADGSRCIVALLQTVSALEGTVVGQKALATEEALTVLTKGCNIRVTSPAVAFRCLAVLLGLVQAGAAATGRISTAADVVQPPDGSQEPLPAASTLPVHMPAAANDADNTTTTTTTNITTAAAAAAAPESALSQHPAREVLQSLSQALNPSHVDLLLEAILNPALQTDFLLYLLAELSVLERGAELLAPRLQALQGKVQQVLPTGIDDDEKRATEYYLNLKQLCGRLQAARAERWQRLQQAHRDMQHAAVRCAEVYSMYCSELESVKLQVLVGAVMQRLVAAVEHCEACHRNFTVMCGSG